MFQDSLTMGLQKRSYSTKTLLDHLTQFDWLSDNTVNLLSYVYPLNTEFTIISASFKVMFLDK